MCFRAVHGSPNAATSPKAPWPSLIDATEPVKTPAEITEEVATAELIAS